jgi:glycosyltransferase involved in cell wall biosynthesis
MGRQWTDGGRGNRQVSFYAALRMSAEEPQVRSIALVSPGYPPTVGGVERHVARLASGLAGLGNRVDVLTHDVSGEPPDSTSEDGVRVLRFPRTVRAQHYSASGAMWRHLRSAGGRYDIIHAHNYHALPLLMAATTARGRTVLTPHYHGESASSFRNVLHRVYRLPGGRAARSAAKVICVSSSEAELVARDLGVPPGRLVVIPNGVDARRLRHAVPIADVAPTVLVVGRLEPYKRVDRAIAAMAELPELHLRIAGGGEDRQRLAAVALAAEVGHRVHFLDRVPDDELARWFRTARVVVSLSDHEAFGLVAAEALAAGAPVALSDIPAHRDIARLAPERCRLIGDTTDTHAVADAIRRAAGLAQKPVDVPDWGWVAHQTNAVYDAVEPGQAP